MPTPALSLPSPVGVLWVALLLTALLTGGCSTPRKAAPLTPLQAAASFDDPARDRWQKPDVLVRTMRIEPGMKVVDLGAGTGYLLPHLSRAVGPTGKVYAVEIQPGFVELLKKRVAAEKLSNVVVLQSTAQDLPLGELVDRVVLLDTYRELQDPLAMLAALKGRLQATGRLFVIDARPDPPAPGPQLPGPPPEQRVSEETVEAEARGAGLVASLRFDVLERQYVMMFVNAEEIQPGERPEPDPRDENRPADLPLPVSGQEAPAGNR